MSSDFEQALEDVKGVLRSRWGPHIAGFTEFLRNFTQGPVIKKHDATGTGNLATKLKNASLMAEMAGDASVLANLEAIRKIIKARVPHLQEKFCKVT